MPINRPTDGLGYRQTWQDVTGSRAAGTTYTNTTGKPIEVHVRCSATNTGVTVTLTINGLPANLHNSGNASALIHTVTGLVPPGGTYSVTLNAMAVTTWHELR